MARSRIGVCGLPRSLEVLDKTVDVVEVQETFYHPKPQKYSRWKSRTSKLEFTVKAWFLITHGANKLLLRKAKIELSKLGWRHGEFGGFQVTEANLWALEATLEAARSLNAQIIVFQTPSSVKIDETLLENAGRLFDIVKKKGFKPVWEPRGYGIAERRLLEDFSKRHGIPIVVDPLRREPFPVWRGWKVEYYRLHGLGGREVNYKYKYTEEDLRRLKTIILKRISLGLVDNIYILFNNIYMYDDALKFKKMLKATWQGGD